MPELPRELEREIFELAIGSNRHNAAFKLTLNLVAHRVHLWVDRVFYEVVSISGKRHAAKFLDLIDSNSKSSGFFSVVKALSLRVMIQETQIHKILSACSAVQLLDCYAHCWPGSVWKRTLLAIVQLPLRRFSVNFEFVSEIPITPSTWLSRLKHIYLSSSEAWGQTNENTGSTISILGRLPHLTHVALTSDAQLVVPAHAADVCLCCPRLRLLIIIWEYEGEGSDSNYIDSRVVRIHVEDVDRRLNPMYRDWGFVLRPPRHMDSGGRNH